MGSDKRGGEGTNFKWRNLSLGKTTILASLRVAPRAGPVQGRGSLWQSGPEVAIRTIRNLSVEYFGSVQILYLLLN